MTLLSVRTATDWGRWLSRAMGLVPSPSFSWREGPGYYTLEAWLPGVGHKDLFVGVAGRSFRLSAASRIGVTDGRKAKLAYVRRERLLHTLSLPNDVNTANIQGSFRHGMLSLFFPKGRPTLLLPEGKTTKEKTTKQKTWWSRFTRKDPSSLRASG